MLVTLSVSLFVLALAGFIYLFDRFMGASDTANHAQIMADIQDQEPASQSECSIGRAAGSGV